MLTLWSPKGGSGLSTIAAGMAATSARTTPTTIVDLAGDLPALCGLAHDPDTGIGDWLAGGAPPEALERIALPVAPGLTLLPADPDHLPHVEPAIWAALSEGLPASAAVVDAGTAATGAAAAAVEGAGTALVVTRCCYVSLRRAVGREGLLAATSGAVVLAEAKRALSVDDVARVLGVPVLAVVEADPSVARAVDAGTLVTRVPRGLARALAPIVHLVPAGPDPAEGAEGAA